MTKLMWKHEGAKKKINAKTKGFPEGGGDYGKELFAVVQKE